MSNEKIEYLNPNSLHPFENNPFQSVDENEYNELRDSIMEFGIITPLIVNKSDNDYEIISGQRRWRFLARFDFYVGITIIVETNKKVKLFSWTNKVQAAI